MIRITAVTSHRHAGKLRHKMVLKPGPDDLFTVIEIFRPDKSDNRIDHKGSKLSGITITAGFHCYLVRAEMGIGGKL